MTAPQTLSRGISKGFGVLLGLLLVLVGFSIVSFRNLSSASDWNTHSYQVLLESHLLSQAIVKTDLSVRNFVVTGREASLDDFRRGQLLFDKHWKVLAALTSDRASHGIRLAKLREQQRDYLQNHAQRIIAARRSTPDFARAVVASMRFSPARNLLITQMQDTLAEFERVEEGVRVKRSARQARAHARTQWALALGGLFSIGLTASLVSVAARSSRRLDRVNAQLRDEKNIVEAANAQLAQINDQLQNEIAARRAADEKLRRSVLDLQRSNQELEHFAYVASHDLQEPLRAVSGCVQVLKKRYGGQLDERADQFIEHAVEGALRMQNLINDLLSFSRIGAKRGSVAPAPGETILRGALQSVSVALSESGAQFTHDELPTLICDSGQIEQVLQNLISNALKFRGEGAPRVHVGYSTTVEGDSMFHILSVEDNGPGIEAQYFERIFVMFQRLHTRAAYPGTGIGLAICKKIIERHGGAIWVESEAGVGTKFFFSLPLYPEDFSAIPIQAQVQKNGAMEIETGASISELAVTGSETEHKTTFA